VKIGREIGTREVFDSREECLYGDLQDLQEGELKEKRGNIEGRAATVGVYMPIVIERAATQHPLKERQKTRSWGQRRCLFTEKIITI